jgi:hypothetical protein
MSPSTSYSQRPLPSVSKVSTSSRSRAAAALCWAISRPKRRALGQLVRHVVSLKTNPPIKPGTKDPYVPKK